MPELVYWVIGLAYFGGVYLGGWLTGIKGRLGIVGVLIFGIVLVLGFAFAVWLALINMGGIEVFEEKQSDDISN